MSLLSKLEGYRKAAVAFVGGNAAAALWNAFSNADFSSKEGLASFGLATANAVLVYVIPNAQKVKVGDRTVDLQKLFSDVELLLVRNYIDSVVSQVKKS